MPLGKGVRYRRGRGKRKHLRYAFRGNVVVEIKNTRTGKVTKPKKRPKRKRQHRRHTRRGGGRGKAKAK